MRKLTAIPGMLAAGIILAAAPAHAQESKVTHAQLPAAVQQAVAANSQGATVKGYAREVEHGQTFYEVEMTANGLSRDVLMDSTGAVVEAEQQVTMGALPAPVQSALTSKAGKGRIVKIESLTKKGQLVAYEAQVHTGKKHSEIQVGPAGEALDHEE